MSSSTPSGIRSPSVSRFAFSLNRLLFAAVRQSTDLLIELCQGDVVIKNGLEILSPRQQESGQSIYQILRLGKTDVIIALGQEKKLPREFAGLFRPLKVHLGVVRVQEGLLDLQFDAALGIVLQDAQLLHLALGLANLGKTGMIIELALELKTDPRLRVVEGIVEIVGGRDAGHARRAGETEKAADAEVRRHQSFLELHLFLLGLIAEIEELQIR